MASVIPSAEAEEGEREWSKHMEDFFGGFFFHQGDLDFTSESYYTLFGSWDRDRVFIEEAEEEMIAETLSVRVWFEMSVSSSWF